MDRAAEGFESGPLSEGREARLRAAGLGRRGGGADHGGGSGERAAIFAGGPGLVEVHRRSGGGELAKYPALPGADAEQGIAGVSDDVGVLCTRSEEHGFDAVADAAEFVRAFWGPGVSGGLFAGVVAERGAHYRFD